MDKISDNVVRLLLHMGELQFGMGNGSKMADLGHCL